MKRFPFIQAALITTLMVIAASCTMPREASGGYYEEDAPARRNGYYSNPYGSNVIILERDPYTGQYYEVTPYGGAYASPYGYYSSPYNSYYGRDYNRRRGGYGYTPQNNNNNSQTQAQRQESQRQLGEAKGAILGPKKHD